MKNALNSMWGEGHAKALEANRARVRECVAGPGLRKQEILTPPCIIDAIKDVWERINLDPCSPATGVDWAERFYTGSPHNGLEAAWVDRTFVNPPYGKLKDWLAKAELEWSKDPAMNMALLIPVRSHRKWWRAFVAGRTTVYLNPVKFVGYKQAFPAPLCVVAGGSLGSFVTLRLSRLGLGGKL